MKRKQFFALRNKLYKVAGELGTLAEGQPERSMIAASYRDMSRSLDHIEMLGEQLGYIDIDTGNVIPKRLKKDVA